MSSKDIKLQDMELSFLSDDTLKSLRLNSELSDTMKNLFIPSMAETGLGESIRRLADMEIPSICNTLANIKMPSALESIFSEMGKENEAIKAFSKNAEAIAGIDILKNFRPQMPEMSAIENFHISIPPNPQHETNEKLDVLLEQNKTTNVLLKDYISQSTSLMTSLNDTMVKLAVDTAQMSASATQSAAQSRQQNTLMIRISMITLIITAVVYSWNCWESSHDIKLVDLNNSLLAQISEGTKAIISNQNADASIISKQKENSMSKTSLKNKYGVYYDTL